MPQKTSTKSYGFYFRNCLSFLQLNHPIIYQFSKTNFLFIKIFLSKIKRLKIVSNIYVNERIIFGKIHFNFLFLFFFKNLKIEKELIFFPKCFYCCKSFFKCTLTVCIRIVADLGSRIFQFTTTFIACYNVHIYYCFGYYFYTLLAVWAFFSVLFVALAKTYLLTSFGLCRGFFERLGNVYGF